MFNPNSRRVVIMHTYRVLPEPQPCMRPEYEITVDDDVTATSAVVDATAVSDKVPDYQYLVGALHRDSDDYELYKTVSVAVETFDEADGPIVVTYRRRVSV